MAKRIACIALNALALLVLCGTLLFFLLRWRQLPDAVPSGYTFSGEISARAGKASLLILPAFSAVLFAVFTLLRTVRLRSLGRIVRIPLPQLLAAWLKLAAAAGLCRISLCSALLRPLGAWFPPLFLLFFFAPLVGYICFFLFTHPRGNP